MPSAALDLLQAALFSVLPPRRPCCSPHSRCPGVPTIAASLEDSTELELSDDKLAVRRTRALPADDDSDERSIYAKGPFPAATTLEALQAFFGAYGTVNRVYMRRFRSKEKVFKGSVFVEFGAVSGGGRVGVGTAR